MVSFTLSADLRSDKIIASTPNKDLRAFKLEEEAGSDGKRKRDRDRASRTHLLNSVQPRPFGAQDQAPSVHRLSMQGRAGGTGFAGGERA